MGDNSQAALRRLIEKLEELDEEKRNLAEEMKGILRDAKSEGFNTKAIREVLRLRRMDSTKREELEADVEAYRAALGMLASLPLGEAAIAAAKH